MFDLTLKNGEQNDNLLVALEKANYSAIKKYFINVRKEIWWI